MSRVLAIVEGQTEQTFVRDVLAPDLGIKGVFVTAALVGKPGRKGGSRPWPSVRRDVLAALKQDRQGFCTTMFDYYALPADWPDVLGAKQKHFRQAVHEIERAIESDIQRALGDSLDPTRFVPYIQLHEFEALLFSDTSVLAAVLERIELKGRFDDILAERGEPEAIDDNPATAPSKRILKLARGYEKSITGVLAAKRIGLARMRAACPHFNEWVERLESLGTRRVA